MSEGVKVRFGCRVERINDGEEGPSVMLSTGETIKCDLNVGADGTPSLPSLPPQTVHKSYFSHRHQIHRSSNSSRWRRCEVTAKQHLLPMHHNLNRHALLPSHSLSNQRTRNSKLVGPKHALHLRPQAKRPLIRRIIFHPPYTLYSTPRIPRLLFQLPGSR